MGVLIRYSAKMTVHIGFVILCRTVTTDSNVSNQATKIKVIVHIEFAKRCTAVTTDGNISNPMTKVKMTAH